MSENEKTTQRLLKANNVQRRRFEKMAQELFDASAKQARQDRSDKRDLVTQDIIINALGDDYDRLKGLRKAILEAQEMVDTVLARAKVKGLSFGSYYSSTSIGYYRNPIENSNDEDSCTKPGVDLELTGFSIPQCRSNNYYPELERRMMDYREDSVVLEDAQLALRQLIWEAVGTPEIVDGLKSFRNRFVDTNNTEME